MARRLPVCPSVTRRYCVETAIHILKLFSPSDSFTILVFRTKFYGNIPTETTGRRMQGEGGYETSRNFRPIFRFISEMIQDKVIVPMVCE